MGQTLACDKYVSNEPCLTYDKPDKGQNNKGQDSESIEQILSKAFEIYEKRNREAVQRMSATKVGLTCGSEAINEPRSSGLR